MNATSPEPTATRMSRRNLLRTTGLLGLAVGSAGVLSACAAASSGGNGSAPAAGATSAGNPLGVDAGAPLEVFVFKGGYGDAYAVYDESLYSKAFPKAKLSHNGIQQMQTQLQPRFVGGNPPDLIDNSGPAVFPLPTLVANGQVADLTPLLNAPSYDTPGKTVAQTLQPGALDAVTYDGKVMGLPYVSTVKGLWYSQSLFDKHGWTWPSTWDGLTALLGQMKQAGIAPFAYGGSDAANYFLYPLFSLAGKQGGAQALIDLDNLKPGAWQSEPMQNAAAAIAKLAATGMFLAGSAGLNHTQAQTAWVQGKAGIYASGSWIESEMTGITPADFQMTFGNVPLLTAGDKLPATAVLASALEVYLVPAQAKNQRGAMELLRIMLSKQGAARFSQLTHAPTVVTGATGNQSFGSTAYASVAKALAASGSNTFTYLVSSWYPTIGKELNVQIANLLAGRVDGPGFLKAVQAASDKVASDSSIPKHHR
ncbi:N-acetylglucosamine transport system substrate-binding protein [Streptacidiphilus sp. MAP12-20]|uniref:N-acetylglucosamine/diacetylchitobiose ABC transporter substrate-binding protein n=1 Tax=Streptacidiphilus sp. MAP12-20 TaxID=3156299 RepID=UPI003517412A